MNRMLDLLITDLRYLVSDLGKDGGLTSPSIYDTAQVLRLASASESTYTTLNWLLAQQKADGVKQRLAAFKMTGAAPPPRSHYGVWKDGAPIGETCSGGLSPTLGAGIGLAYLPVEFAKPGSAIEIDIRGRRFPAQVEKKPLHRAG